MAGNDDVASLLGAPELAPTVPTPATQGDPAVWTVLGEAGTNPQGQLAVGSTLYNRRQASGAKTFGEVATDPANGYEAWQDANARAQTQKLYPVGSPAYNAAQQTLSGLDSGTIKPLPYDSFYSPKAQAALGRKPPDFENGTGVDIGGNRFFSGAYKPPGGPDVASLMGAPELSGAAPGSPEPAPNVTVGPQFLPATPGQQNIMRARQAAGLYDPTAPQGSDLNPYAEKSRKDGTAEPLPAGAYVGLDNQFHPAPRSTVQLVGNALAGLGQGLGTDTAVSAARFGLGGGDPFAAAYSQTQGGPSAQAVQQAALASFKQEQADAAMRHAGEPEFQTARFAGQAIPATLAASVVPEVTAFRGVPLAGRLATNALRGIAAAGTNVGANPNIPVAQQLETGAALGAATPEALGAVGRVGSAIGGLGGLGRTVSPEVADLADTAQTKYGIPLRSGQVMGANGDRAAAYADSNLLGSSAKVRANNDAQRQAFMRGVTGTYGDASGDVSPEAMSAAKANVVAPMNDVASRTSLNADAVQTRVSQIIGDAQKVLPDNEVAPLLKLATSIGDVRTGPIISGEAYQALTRTGAPLDRLIQSSDPNVSHYAGQIRDALDGELQASAAPEDVAALQNARFQYKNLMTVAKLAPKADANGIISPALLRGAVSTQFKNQAFQGAGDLGELARIGQIFMKEPPQSGTAPRAKDLLSGLGIGAGAAGATELADLLMHQPGNALGPLAATGVGFAARSAANALKESRIGGSAAGIIARSLPNAPGSAFSGLPAIGAGAKKVSIPLSALMGVRLSSPVGANAQ